MLWFKRALFLCVFVPLAFIWDMVYLLVKVLYDISTTIDEVGGNYLERIRILLWEN